METTDLVRSAAEWRLISLLFECPVGSWQNNVKQLGEEIEDPTLKEAAKCALAEAGEGLYHSVFGPGGPAPGREVSYRDWVQPGYLLSELQAFYKAFSYHPAVSETPDHIAVETGFVGYLKLKQAYAEISQDSESASVTAKAIERFTEEHLSKTTEKMKDILSTSDITYLVLASEALFERVGPDKDKKKEVKLPVLPEMDDETFGCGES